MTGNKIAVDLSHLLQTCKAAHEIALRLRTDLREATAQIQQGVWIGLNSPSGEVDAARRALDETLKVHADNSGHHIAVADHLSSALKLVCDHYRSVDESIDLSTQRMLALLEEAEPQKPVAKHWVEQ